MPYWKTGFYRIAVEAGVPIVLGFIDYERRTMGIGGTFEPSGEVERDLGFLRRFYAAKAPLRPQNRGPIAFPP